jgi:glycosyltransferase involved in cell wall biosynthesis
VRTLKPSTMPLKAGLGHKYFQREKLGNRSPPLLVFADDWGRHPSSCQYLVRHLLEHYEACWINTIGTREPRLDLATFWRGFEKIANWVRGSGKSTSVPANLRVLSPKMWPWFSHGFDQRINRELLFRQLAPVIRSLPVPPIAVTTLPIVADLMGLLPVQRWVYYCVDDFGEWPGLAQAVLRSTEERLIQRADSLIVVSETLQDKMAQRGRKAHLLTHGIEPDFWKINSSQLWVPQLQELERPFVVFWGVIDRRMDISLVRQLATDMKVGTIVLVGPEADPDPALYRLPRVVRIPAVPFDFLPHIAAAASVLVMPYADLPVTRAMQPLKLKEYLATGRPVVVRDLPANRSWGDCLDLASSAGSFARLVLDRIEHGVPDNQKQARCRLKGETWAEKARLFESWALMPNQP